VVRSLQGHLPRFCRVSLSFIASENLDEHADKLPRPRHSDNEKYKDVFFAKIDVEELSDLSDELDVQAMPTFLLFKDGVKVGALLEPKPSALLELVEKGI